ncbi:MAG: ParB/RepB/Spo0J family partition protein [Acidobacteriaceae bacterium]
MSRNEGKNPGKVEPPKRRALGKGLESLLSTPAPHDVVARSRAYAAAGSATTPMPHTADDPFVAHAGGTPREVPTDQIDPNPYQTRMQVDEQKLDELARSIVANGVVQPIIVRPLPNGRFQLIAGERRWRASIKAGKETVPAILRQVGDEQAMEMTIVENLQRADLNPMEQARAYDRLSRDFHMTQEQVAQRTGKDRATVANFLRLLRLPAPVQGKVESGELSFGHARALLSLDGAEEILKAMTKVVALSMSVRQTETYVQGLMDPERKRKKSEEKAKLSLDPNVREAQDRLQRQLGLKVRIEDKNGRGRVTIEYSGLEDFDALMAALGAAS